MQMYHNSMSVMMAQLINTIFVALLLMIDNSLASGINSLRTPIVRSHEAAKDFKYYALDFTGLVEQYGYQAESHDVTTQDGYILRIFRIISKSPPPHKLKERPVVFMQHGMVGSSDNFVVFGPNMSLAFKLSDAGYDLWFGNTRGNTYCRRHVKLTPNDERFWDFSLDELASFDVPAMIDYVLNYTEQSSMKYIGYSVGSTILALLVSQRPEYNEKIDLVIALSPLCKWTILTSSRYLILQLIKLAQTFLPDGRFEVSSQGVLPKIIVEEFCAYNKHTKNLCFSLVNFFVGASQQQFTDENLINLVSYWPAGTSAKLWYHLYQIGSYPGNDTRHYDYESNELNLMHYGQTQPPTYDLSNIVSPIVIFSGINDQLVVEEDIKLAMKIFNNSRNIHIRLVDGEFAHLHYIVAKDVNKFVTQRLLDVLDKFYNNLLF